MSFVPYLFTPNYSELCLTELTVTVVMCLDILEVFIMTILEEEGPNENYSVLRVLT